MRRLPLFVLDSRELYEPVAVEAVVETAKIGKATPLLSSLPLDGGRMNFPPNPELWAPAVQARFDGIGYWRRVDAGGFVWVQHWVFYLHNPRAYAGYGVHEGDWEFVQIGYARDLPVCMTASQHHAGEARMFWDVETRPDSGLAHPVVYVARDSHANYFEPVRGSIADDVADGKGKALNLTWREFGPWASWSGQWGNSTGAGKSPDSPGQQGDRWHAPQRFHSRAR